MNKKSVILAVSLFVGAMVFAGCSNNASEEELQQLRALQSQISSLEQQINARQQEKADLQKQVADRDARLKQCQDDTEEARRALGK